MNHCINPIEKSLKKGSMHMSFIVRFLKRLVSVQEYPRYIVKAFIQVVAASVWRLRGIILGHGITWHGMPILSKETGSAISIGNYCTICSSSKQTALGVSHPVILRTLFKGANIKIGSNVRMSGTTICAAESVIIGDRCVIGSNAIISDTDFHSLDPLLRSSPDDARCAIRKPVLIGNDIFIGGGSVILKGVHIGDGAVIGAGSIITKDVPPRMIVAGNPAKLVGPVPVPPHEPDKKSIIA
jgi:acetyltransferase-like isoleucine patch superfamily enzyme